MGGQSYTVEQLEHLQHSPLVQKPEGLPSILQWMDVPADPNTTATASANAAANRRPRSGNLRDGDTTATGENRAERLPVINPMGHFGRRSSTQPEDTVLGPPKLSFTSASRTAKAAAELPEKRTGIISTDGDQLGDRFPRERGDRWTRDRDTDRPRDKAGVTNGRRPVRDEGEGWTNVKGRKSLGQDDFDRGFGRNGDRDREKVPKDGEVENGDASTRRLATGRDKVERWGRREDTTVKEVEGTKFGATGGGGWRDRERDREQRDRGDRDWNRGGNKAEQDPEWMDARADKKETKAHTQEDFQRWKELMKAKDAPVEEKEEPKAEPPAPVEPSIPASVRQTGTPSATEPNHPIFGNWGRDKAPDTTVPEMVAKPRTDKKSRFMGMFTKPEEAAIPSQNPLPTPASPGPGPMPGHMPGLGVDGSNADKEGFQRILQMLGGTNISAAQASAGTPINGSRQGGIALDFLRQSPPQEQQESRPQPRQQVPRTLEQQHMLENILAPRPGLESRPSQARLNAMSPDNTFLEQFGLPRPESNRPGDEFSNQQPPPRNSSAQDAHLHAILNGRVRDETSRDPQTKQRERDFLLTLMQQPSRGTPPQQMHHQSLPRPAPESQNMTFFDPSAQRHQGQPKGRPGLPPGFMEDQRMYAENEMMRRQAELREQQLREASIRDMNMQHQQEAIRNKNARLQMNFAHDDPAIMNLQRRNTAGEIPRQMTNMGIPSQPMPEMQYLAGRQAGMPPTPQERPNIAPPPGFGAPPMRQPPGLGGHGTQQQLQQQQQMGPGPSFSAGNTPLGHPPGFAPPGGMRGAIYPGQVQGNMPPQGPPQGYFPPPPGYGPPMGMRGGDDPRVMFEQQFGGPNQRQLGRPGPPNMY
ncbi:hypothetical protein K505DRAFT_163220 [Melanomma pulvis-pyrius CBS 109.77]|uniref:Uncharacterized protein n=1 Tax=Melanomma pulvis-pyrius CBS 109.77 TaxID=1314802 RepID=A0A6A6XIZ6_9PLEO|nr:hypothetical protein K505DRAFT_163220 [Melanomma pulvis-pyrius CBS 109.77]